MAVTPDITPPHKTVSRRKKRALWVWALWVLCGLLCLLLLAGAYAWSNRYALLEDLAIDTFAEDGIEAELDIETLTKTQAVLKNVRLSYDGQMFFSAKHIAADYKWRDALEGQVKSIKFTQLQAHITVDDKGQIIDGWLPPRTDESGTINALPENGISIEDGTFFIKSPYAAGEITGDVALKTLQNFTANVTLKPTNLTYNEMSVSGGGAFQIDTTQDRPRLNGDMTLSKLSHPAIEVQDLTLSLDGSPDTEAQSFDGTLTLDFKRLETAQAFMDESQISWDGLITKTDALFDLSGQWHAQLQNAHIPDPARRDELAATLSFSTPLSKSPLAQNFIPDINRVVKSLFAGSDINARGQLKRSNFGFVINLSEPAQINSPQTQLTLTPHETEPAYYFNRNARTIMANLKADFTEPANISLSDINFKARSINGFRLDGVDSFNANIQTQSQWNVTGIDGRPARLLPISVMMNYQGSNTASRTVDLSGDIDYDGVLPGAYVSGLKAAGDMRLTLSENGQMAVGYTPKTSTPLQIDQLETASGWSAYDFMGDITPNAALFHRKTATTSTANISLSNLSTNIERPTDKARLAVETKTLTARGQLSTVKTTLSQDWDMQFTQAHITSDDLPGPDTRITLPEGQLNASLETDKAPRFDITTPSANIETQLIKVDNMQLRLFGQTDNYDIEHSGGRVKITGNTLPPLPIEGALNVLDGAFIGTAKARLPQADNTPIALSYNIRDGVGYADVDIAALEFTPNGLQPQNLISALRGKIAQVEGLASAQIRLKFARGEALQSSGKAQIINMNFGTAPGPLTGINMELSMDSVLPLISRGRQRMTVAEFDPGIPLQDGVIDFELVDGGVKIYSAQWPVGGGFFSLDPFTWKYGAPENRLVMRLSDVQLGEFMETMGNDSIEATGQVQGEFPIIISGVNVRVDKGQLLVKDGGTIRYTPKDTSGLPPVSYTQEEAIDILRTKDQARYSSLARDALREFKYKELSIKVDGSLDGEVELGTVFNGSNPKVLNGQPFEFDINVVGELFNILRSFDSNAQIKSELERQGISTDGLTINP